jgi:hypothetical protein
MAETVVRIEENIDSRLNRIEQDIRELRNLFIGGLVTIVAAVVVTGIVA